MRWLFLVIYGCSYYKPGFSEPQESPQNMSLSNLTYASILNIKLKWIHYWYWRVRQGLYSKYKVDQDPTENKGDLLGEKYCFT